MTSPSLPGTELSLEDWLECIPADDGEVIDYCFPTPSHRTEFLKKIATWPEHIIHRVLSSFLIPNCSMGTDDQNSAYLKYAFENDRELLDKLLSRGYYRRLFLKQCNPGSKITTWEGITWVLDLLPHHPREALEGLDAYFLAHAVLLPDGRFDGLQDAKSVIRARYIIRANPTASSILKALAPREFECLIYRLYTEMGYKCVLTPRGADGGRYVIAVSRQPGKKERLLIECKRYGDPVGVEKVRCLLGVVTDEKANKGLLVSASQFTKGARDFASRNPVELMSDRKLIPLLNEHLGSSWPLEVDSLAAEP